VSLRNYLFDAIPEITNLTFRSQSLRIAWAEIKEHLLETLVPTTFENESDPQPDTGDER
jgi:hypothetical protein